MKAIQPAELENLLDADQPIEIVDIRPRRKFEKGHIDGARWLPPCALSIETLVCSRQLLPTEPLYLVSETGASAHASASELERQGLNNLIVVTGGIRAWQHDGFQVVATRSDDD